MFNTTMQRRPTGQEERLTGRLLCDIYEAECTDLASYWKQRSWRSDFMRDALSPHP
jgi:hypothetical protein